MAWDQAALAWRSAAAESWLLRSLWRLSSSKAARSEEGLEAACAELLTLTCAAAPAGFPLSQTWQDFAGEMRQPDHPAQRLPSNLQRYAGNYMNILMTCAALAAVPARPVLLCLCGFLELLALFAPPEMFDVDVLQSKAAGGGYRAVGGPWLRYGMAAVGQAGCWAAGLGTASGARGLAVGALVVVSHALLRTRPWTEVAKEHVTRLKGQ
mmetsp:Transcript_55296/g.103711  ORF Transcript_55296/g.103711 Transcript_55296/m.103711 type:complete len:210 (+) Transcript_55296:36-665(+)